MDRQKILDALKVIKDTCNDNDCKRCPLADGKEECIVQAQTPAFWDVKGDEKVVWRAFDD